MRSATMRIGPVRLVLVRHGGVDESHSSLVAGVLSEVYEKVRGPDYVEIHLYPSRTLMEAVLAEDAYSIGVAAIAVYTVMHEAWHGYPRLHIVPGELIPLTDENRALLVHEAFHSILHGSLEYYLVRVPDKLYKLYGDHAPIVAHVAATIIKDLEVHNAMRLHGYGELLPHLSRGDTSCSTLEELSDALKATTARIVLGLNDAPCGFVDTVKALRSLLTGRGRPWEKLEWFTLVFAEELKKLGHVIL